jgi:hypothetical protein
MNFREATLPVELSSATADRLDTQKRRVRALKRVLIAKAEVRRLKALVGRKRLPSR